MLGNLDAGDETYRYLTIEKAAKDYPVSTLCKIFGVSRSGYYAFLKRKKLDRDREDKALVMKVYKHYNGVYGYRQLQLFLLQDHGVWMNHMKVLRLMQVLGIRSRIRRKHRCNYVFSTEGRVAKNLLKRDFQAEAPNQKWVTDITQYRVGEFWLYLSAIKDLFNNEVIAYQTSYRNDNELVLQTFQQLGPSGGCLDRRRYSLPVARFSRSNGSSRDPLGQTQKNHFNPP
nr:IS3 family transposase [Paenibacillus sp. JZ16]